MNQDNIFVLSVPTDTSYISTNIKPGQLPAIIEKALTVTDQPLDLLPQQFTTAEANEGGKQLMVGERSINLYLTDLQENKQISKFGRGK